MQQSEPNIKGSNPFNSARINFHGHKEIPNSEYIHSNLMLYLSVMDIHDGTEAKTDNSREPLNVDILHKYSFIGERCELHGPIKM